MSRPLRRLSAASMLIALLGLAVVPSSTAAAASVNPFACTPKSGVDHFTVLNVRGSSEGGSAAKAKAFRPDNRPDFAARVPLKPSRVVDVAGIENRLAARSAAVGRKAVFVHLELSYPAWMGTTRPADAAGLRASFETYQASVAKGVESLEQAAAAARAGCSSTRVVALGYSQGAEVLQRFMAAARNDRYASTVAAVVLVGNPLRDSGSSAVTRDPGVPAVKATGLTRYARGSVKVRAAWAGKVSDFCYSLDQICALPAATGAVVSQVASSGKYTAAAAKTYRTISWKEHAAYPAAFRTAILNRF